MTAKEKQEQTKTRRKIILNSRIKLPLKPRIYKLLYPSLIESSLFNSMYGLLRPLFIDIQETLLPALPQIYQEYNNEVRIDSYSETIKDKFSSLRARSDIIIDEDEISDVIQAYEYRINRFQKEQLDKACMGILGIPILRRESWYFHKKQAFIDKNTSLIRMVSKEYIDSLEITVQSSIEYRKKINELHSYILNSTLLEKQKLSSNMVNPYIKKSDPIKRLQFIARDQVSSYYSSLNMSRQIEAGIEEYYWGTMRDSRVRPDHRIREMKTYKWNDPPFDGHPGEAPGCRCIAYPNFIAFF